MDFVTVPGGTFDLGWRFSPPEIAQTDPDAMAAIQGYISMCSPKRQVVLPSFEIARQALPLAELVGDPYELADIVDLPALCDLVDRQLASRDLRLPTEDQLEVAAGGSLFPWGEHIPDGIPYAGGTSFAAHREPNALGLELRGNPYQTELSRTALKFGDGGTSICGSEPWPVAWLALSTCFRLVDRDICECFPETLEDTFVRPVRFRAHHSTLE